MKTWILKQLTLGLTPTKLAWCISLGLVLGVFPALGTTTLLCFLAASIGRFNQPAMQSVNYVAYPLQFVLLIPFYKLGAILFHESPITLTAAQVKRMISSGLWKGIQLLWTTTVHAIVAWALVAIPVTLVLAAVFRVVFKKILSGDGDLQAAGNGKA